MGVTDYLKQAGFKPEKSTLGERKILKGIYKAMFVDGSVGEENQYGQSYIAKFKVTERLSGTDTISTFPEFVGFFAIDDKNAMNAKKGIKKLINGFCSVGINIDTSSDPTMYASFDSQRGSAELYIKGYLKKKTKQDENGNWVDAPEKEDKQDFGFLTQVNAELEAAKQVNKDGHPL